MIDNHQLCYNALAAQDSRFDGHFFVAVSSTGIYCRPICSARLPKAENCHFYPSAAAAESAGYRPCMKCRPELAPGSTIVGSAARLPLIAAEMITAGALADVSLSELAEQLGVSDRHLRRSFHRVYGVTPQRYAQTQRLLLAKRLLSDTNLSITDVAMNAGFSSLRRFNDQLRQHYRLTPSALRKNGRGSNLGDKLQLTLSFRPPFDWPRLLAFFQQRSIAGVESVVDGHYRRTLRFTQGKRLLCGWIDVSLHPSADCLVLTIDPLLAPVIAKLLSDSRRVFDLDCKPESVQHQLGALAGDRPGLRLPGAYDRFEMAVRAIVGQQVSVKAAHTLAGRIALCFGERLETPFASLNCIFPDAGKLSKADASSIKALGIVGARAKTIVGLAQAIDSGKLNLGRRANVEETIRALQLLPGIGPWTAQYIAMRALSWPDVFLETDLGVMKAMPSLPCFDPQDSEPKRLIQYAERWRPWRSYAVMHLWSRLSEYEQSKEEPE